MKTRREFCQVCVASAIVGSLRAVGAQPQVGSRTIYRIDLPPVNLAGWEATFLELSFPPGLHRVTSTRASFLDTCSKGSTGFTWKAHRKRFYRLAMCSMNRLGASTCLQAAPAQPDLREYSLWHSTKKERSW